MGSVVNTLWSPSSLTVLQPLASSMITHISAFLNRQIEWIESWFSRTKSWKLSSYQVFNCNGSMRHVRLSSSFYRWRNRDTKNNEVTCSRSRLSDSLYMSPQPNPPPPACSALCIAHSWREGETARAREEEGSSRSRSATSKSWTTNRLQEFSFSSSDSLSR